MADENHVSRLRQGSDAWNTWRRANPKESADLSGADLSGAELSEADLHGTGPFPADLGDPGGDADLSGANLSGANLSGAILSHAILNRANLSRADLSGAFLNDALLNDALLNDADLNGAILLRADLSANLSGANLSGAILSDATLSDAILRVADLSGANLRGANLSRADLRGAHLSEALLIRANLSRADLSGARLSETVFVNVDLTDVIGLETCDHYGPSSIDFWTLEKSHPLPLAFLRGVGLPDNLIDYLPSLLHQAIQYYSCFISYSAKDEDFANRIHADLQNNGVRCWFAPHDMRIGDKILDTIDEALRLRDKVLLILSKDSIASDWVEIEVKKAYAEERTRGQTVLFPIRLDSAVMETKEAWAATLREDRHIGEFGQWKDHDSYRRSLERVLRDLKAAPKVT